MAGSTDPDCMDWTPDPASAVSPQEHHAAPRRRKFDEIVDTSTQYYHNPHLDLRSCTSEERAAHWKYIDRHTRQEIYEQYGIFGCEDGIPVIPRYTRRLGILLYSIPYFIAVATMAIAGTSIEYAGRGIKRRLVRMYHDQATNGPPTTPRKRKYRNIYLTPRQRYEQRSARSIKIRDMPGRFPGTPFSAYSSKASPPPRTPTLTASLQTHPMPGQFPGTPTYPESPTRPDAPTCPESPMQQKQARRLSKRTKLSQQATLNATAQMQHASTSIAKDVSDNIIPPGYEDIDSFSESTLLKLKPYSPNHNFQDDVSDLVIPPGYEDIESFSESTLLKLKPYSPYHNFQQDATEAEEAPASVKPMGPYDPLNDPALAIAPNVRVYGQPDTRQAPDTLPAPQPGLQSTVPSNNSGSRALTSLASGPSNVGASKPKKDDWSWLKKAVDARLKKSSKITKPSRLRKKLHGNRISLPNTATINDDPASTITVTLEFHSPDNVELTPDQKRRDPGNISTKGTGSSFQPHSSANNMINNATHSPAQTIETGSSSHPNRDGELSVESLTHRTGNSTIDNATHGPATPTKTGSSSHPNRDGELSIESEPHSPSTPIETGLSSHPDRDGELSFNLPGDEEGTEGVSNKASSNSLHQRFKELEVEQYVSPRRASARKEKLAQKEAIEQAAREKKEAEERAQREKEEAELQAALDREKEEQLQKQGARRFTKEPIIQVLTAEQEDRLDKAMAKGQKVTAMNGTELTARDWKTILEPEAWLNDNIIVAYLEYVIKMAHERVGLKRNAPPKMHAFNNNFFNNLRAQGHEGVRRWTRRPKIQGKDLLPLEYLFIPVNASGNHWTLAVISPMRRTIEYFDSLHMSGQAEKVIDLMKVWLQGELGDLYKAEEWTVRREDGPHQGNFSDCGVHTVTTAKMIALGIDPMAAPAGVMATQRRRIVAELLNSGFHGEFEPIFEYA